MQEAQETRVRSLGWDDPLEEEMAPHSSIPAWKTPWTEALGGLQSLGFRRVVHSWASKHAGTGIAKTVLKTEVGGLIPHSVNCGCVIETASGTRDSGETGPHHMAVIRRCRGVHRERTVFLNLIEVLLFMMFHCFWCWVLLYVMFTLIAQLVKNPPAVQGDPGSIPGSGRSPGEGIGHPLQYSGLENPMDSAVPGVAKSQTRLSDFHFTHCCLHFVTQRVTQLNTCTILFTFFSIWLTTGCWI